MAAAAFEFLSAPFFNKPMSPDSYQTHWVVGIVYKLHTMTGSLLFFARLVASIHNTFKYLF